MAVVGGGVGVGEGRGSSRPEALKEISSYGKETGNGFSLQGSPGFNIVDIPSLSNKCGQLGVWLSLQKRGVGIYQVGPSSTYMRLLSFSVGSLENRVDFVPESSEMGQNRALFKYNYHAMLDLC